MYGYMESSNKVIPYIKNRHTLYIRGLGEDKNKKNILVWDTTSTYAWVLELRADRIIHLQLCTNAVCELYWLRRYNVV